MDRFQELKEKGYAKLNGEERKEYKALKEQANAGGNGGSGGPKGVFMTQEQLDKIANDAASAAIKHMKTENRDLRHQVQEEKFGEWKEFKDPKKGYKTARLRLYREDAKSPAGVIVRADYLKTVLNPETNTRDKLIYEIEVLYENDKKEVIEVDALDFSKINEIETIELIECERTKMRKVDGKIGVPLKDEDGYPIYKMNSGGYGSSRGVVGEVDLEVVRYDEMFTAKRANGQTFKIHADYLNT